jgi:predicted ATPase
MLNSLHIENIAVVKSADVDFRYGFTVFSGETGAGKSVIIESIKLLLGGKFDKELIRHGESTAMVSALISDITPASLAVLSECGFSTDEDGELLVQRSIGRDGKNQVKIKNHRKIFFKSPAHQKTQKREGSPIKEPPSLLFFLPSFYRGHIVSYIFIRLCRHRAALGRHGWRGR